MCISSPFSSIGTPMAASLRKSNHPIPSLAAFLALSFPQRHEMQAMSAYQTLPTPDCS